MTHLRHLLPFVARYRWRLLAGALCAGIAAAVSALGPFVLRLAVDAFAAGQFAAASLLRYSSLLIIVALAEGCFRFLQRMFFSGTAFHIEFDMRAALFAHYLRMDQAFFGRNHTGDLMARATNDLSAVRQVLGPGLNGSATAVFTFVAAAAFMLAIDRALALIVLLLLPVTTLIFVLLGGRMRAAFTRVQDQFGALSTRAQEHFSGIRTIKAYAQEEAELAVFAEDNRRYRELNLRYVLLSGLLWPSMTLCLGVVAALVLFVGGRKVAAGAMSVGELVQFNAYLGLLAFPMIILGWMLSLYQQAAASMGRLVEVLHQPPAIASPRGALPLPAPRGAVEYRGVGVRFADDPGPEAPRRAVPWMLQDVSFSIPPGGSLAIVGATGAGKTTLVGLLARVRDPDTGAVFLDGLDVRQIDLADLRRAIAYVPQETFLFSLPLRENVAFGIEDADAPDLEARLGRAVEVSRLVNDLHQFPDGLDTLVGERGVTLSGGQKQRVAIARAVLRDPAVLVLDDALSSVDAHTAAQILAGLREVMRDRTSIVIAQRIATAREADQIILLHEGRIVERGTHAELLRLGGHYAAMYRRELLTAEMEG